METKPCIECGEEKPLAKFRTANICKTCHRARVRMERRLHGHHDQASPSVEEKSP
jgi:RNA polymerase-binding transcription factor DksA